MTIYEKQAIDFCNKHNIEMRQMALGTEYIKNGNNHKYAVTLMRMSKENDRIEASYTFEFHGSIADWKKHYRSNNQTIPALSKYDVLACITKNDPGNLDNFLSEFGYEYIKENVKLYESVVQEYQGISRVFNTETMLADLQEIQ